MKRKLIEQAFPLKKVSADSRHEKDMRLGNISTFHIWPARRPLAACRAVTIAALLDDPADADPEMQAEYRRVTGEEDPEQQRARLCEMIGAITRWHSENGPNLQIFKDLIRKTYHGAAPKVLDPFAGGGAIPLEAMRLGCEVTANDYNPVAWFLLKCTLEYPQKLAGQSLELPKLDLPEELQVKKHVGQKGTLADHVELWGHWVFNEVRKAIGEFYPTIDDQPTAAYLWARTVPCQDPHCGAVVPLLKTLWLCNRKGKLRALRMTPNHEAKKVDFEVYEPKDRYDVAEPTMAKAKSTCPLCGTLLTKDHIKKCGFDGRMEAQMTCVIYDTPTGKEYRLPTDEDLAVFARIPELLENVAKEVPFGIPDEPLPETGSSGAGRAFTIPLYGFKKWTDLFTKRQLLSILTFTKYSLIAHKMLPQYYYPDEWVQAISSYLAILIDRLANYNSTICIWESGGELVKQTFLRFALPMTWDFSESNPFLIANKYYLGAIHYTCAVLNNVLLLLKNDYVPQILNSNSTKLTNEVNSIFNAVITDPPYYDAIPYSDLSDFFYVWIKRVMKHRKESSLFQNQLTPKSEELVVHVMPSHNNETSNIKRLTKKQYEAGMKKTFEQISLLLDLGGIAVVVFANKQPEAWEELVTGMIESGLLITTSLPIDTEMKGGVRNLNRASLATSVWLVCRKRPANKGIGRYKAVMQQMKERITDRLRYFWDQGIHGPDFVWSALGPALEAYSQYAEVKRLDGSLFTVAEFLREVRRLVTDFALGRILHQQSTEGLDAWTAYYLMHRYDFGLAPAPAGECLLLAQGYMLNLDDLRGKRGLLQKAKSGNEYTLLPYHARAHNELGEPQPSGALPYIDALHKLMQLWKSGNTAQRDAYAADHGLLENDVFWAMAQAVLEMCDPRTEAAERSLLEALVAWGRGRAAETAPPEAQMVLL
ncbi:cyclin-dependent kinase inhibitor family protein [Candidatus Vecturithrix granuli]|uniref:site-specific DNA-methyltransferase (adenine-specific) n=1 Tax=Vecturithrix granuli TaxID=1499967 RepID=A0A081BWU9_VECG1|nr:cyclin-dependent kinase inhibitor family protein [Candidatus Vecturithrix granuli]